MNGPMYTQDQYLVLGSPTFGRGPADKIESLAPGTDASAVCSGNNCGSATFKGTPVLERTARAASQQQFPAADGRHEQRQGVHGHDHDHAQQHDAQPCTNCPSSPAPPTTVDLTQYPIIYVSNGSSCSPPAYDPFTASYPSSGCAGDVYVSGTYTDPRDDRLGQQHHHRRQHHDHGVSAACRRAALCWAWWPIRMSA